MIFRSIFFFILLTTVHAAGQGPANISYPVCAHPFLPDDPAVEVYFQALQNNNPSALMKFQTVQKTHYEVGEERQFNVLNLEDLDKVKFDQVTATLWATNKGVNIWVDNEEFANGHVNETVIQTILDGLTEETPDGSLDRNKGIVELEHEIFGMPPDIDNNGTIEFLLVDIKDGWDGTGGYVGGFFYPRDQQTSSSGSNKADLMYIDTYPGIYRENAGGDGYEYDSSLGTVAHEYQHLIQFKNDRDEETFVNEGLSEIASYLCGYGLRDPSYYLRSTEISLVDFEGSDFDVSLNHYAKVALFTYFLYEQFGLDLISAISMNENVGISGIDEALFLEGFPVSFGEVVLHFFKTIVTNDPAVFPEYTFLNPELRYLRALPVERITTFPSSKALNIRPYSLYSVDLTNVDSLYIEQEGSYFGALYSRRVASDGDLLLEENIVFPYFDPFFIFPYHTKSILYLNNTNTSSSLILDASGIERNYLTSHYDGEETPTFLITSGGNVNAASFEISLDSTILKSVEFFNGSGGREIVVHLYEEPIPGKLQPRSQSVRLKNAVSNAWIRVDVENFTVMRDKGQVVEIGIEYNDNGSMGYSDAQPKTSTSYLKVGNGTFQNLSRYQIQGGDALDGVWMIRAELGVPLNQKPADSREGDLKWAWVGPNPFSPEEQNTLNINYIYSGTTALQLDVFNILGETVYSATDDRLAGLIYWDGTNNRQNRVATGTYFLRLRSNGQDIYKKILVIQ